jgi:hypothetical protein
MFLTPNISQQGPIGAFVSQFATPAGANPWGSIAANAIEDHAAPVPAAAVGDAVITALVSGVLPAGLVLMPSFVFGAGNVVLSIQNVTAAPIDITAVDLVFELLILRPGNLRPV